MTKKMVIRNFGGWKDFFGKSHTEKCNLRNFSWQSKKISEIWRNASLSQGDGRPWIAFGYGQCELIRSFNRSWLLKSQCG